jgi:hypothetical protein
MGKKERRISMSTGIDSTSRRGFLKGMVAGAGGYAMGSFLIHPREAQGQSIQDYLEKVSMEDRWNYAAGGLIFWQVLYLKEVYDTKGREKYLEQFKKASPVAAARGKANADRLGFTGNDAKSAAVIIPAMITQAYGPQQKYEIEEATGEKARVKCQNCALWNGLQAQKISDDLCSVHSQHFWEGFAKAINPKLTSTLVKARPFGDSVCEWMIELKA